MSLRYFIYICIFLFFFFNDTATTEIYTLSLHDALPIYPDPLCQLATSVLSRSPGCCPAIYPPTYGDGGPKVFHGLGPDRRDRKSTRLNSSHANISYAVFCLKKKKK